ncbi:C2 calcium-dependent domain-containing protein 4C [Varanus komodoensis]|nr:C2 calcium-dependent domain-containing protein 4C [Varanus komodoensis]
MPVTSPSQMTCCSLCFIKASEHFSSPVPTVRIPPAKKSTSFKHKGLLMIFPAMSSVASQLSFKGAIETVFTWTGSKSSRPVPEEKAWQKNGGIFSIIVTPDRIPPFCIPSLEVGHFETQPETVGDPHGHPQRSRQSGKPNQQPRPIRSKSEMCIRKEGMHSQETRCRRETLFSPDISFSSERLERAGDDSDPVTRAALSLPHLPKITTPYGFLTLGESPNIRRKESLFFDHAPAELGTLLSQKKETACCAQCPAIPLAAHSHSASWERSSKKNSWPVSPSKHRNKKTPFLHWAPSSERATNTCKKKRFQLLLKKHLPRIKRLA